MIYPATIRERNHQDEHNDKACPKGMCDAAWRTINQYVFALACGVREFYGGGWMKEPGKVITCCNDGLRPVYFKLEATDEQAGPFLGRG